MENSELLKLPCVIGSRPHEVIYSPSAQQAIYEQLSSMAFVNSYLTVMFREHPYIKALMLNHLQELMEDGEHYGWPVFRCIMLPGEQGRVAWRDEAVKLKLTCALVWHHVVAPQTPLKPTPPPHSWPAPTNLAKPPSGSRQPHQNHRHNRPIQFSTF